MLSGGRWSAATARRREVDLVAGNSHERGQSVAGRLLRILESFSPERTELTIPEISRRAGLPPSTVYRLLAELIDRGVIERTADGRYSVGLRLWEMGKLAPRAERLIEVASPHLHDLYEATGAGLHLAVPASCEALVVVAFCGHRWVDPVAREGTRVPLTSTTIGQVLLAYSSPQALEQVLGGKAESGTNGSAALAEQRAPRRAGRDPALRNRRRSRRRRVGGCCARVRPTGGGPGGPGALCAQR